MVPYSNRIHTMVCQHKYLLEMVLLALIIMVLDGSSTTRRLTRNGTVGCWQERARALLGNLHRK